MLPCCPPTVGGRAKREAASSAGHVLGREEIAGPKATAYGMHGATAIVLLATAALLFT